MDYNLSSKEKNLPLLKEEVSAEFSEALMSSLLQASTEAIGDLVPSLCNTAYGLSSALWVGIQTPIESSKNFASTCYEMGECAFEYSKTINMDTVDDCIYQIEILCHQFDNLSDKEKGELIGTTIRKYGVDAFSGCVTAKAITILRNLKTANRICNLEVMISSPKNKQALIESSLRHASDRKTYIKKVKYNFDAHNKHVLGHNDFKSTGSIWQHNDPEGLIRRFSGTGYPSRDELGFSGFKETVDFKEHIGIWKNSKGTISLPTNRGTIHYGEKGAHIVPSNPNPIIGQI